MAVSETLYPMRLEPATRNYPWGGDRIARRYGRPPSPVPVAESWELSARPDGTSRIASGPRAGQSLASLVEEAGTRLLGTAAPGGRLPLLVKLIDARDRLSVQVHPDDATAALRGGEAKTEMWVFLETDPGARIFAGFRPGPSRTELREALLGRRAAEALREIPVRAGDAVFLPGGRVHAIGEGCLLLEIQQNSDTTYRLYDWDRVDARGRARELHVEKALETIRWEDDGAEARIAPWPGRLPSGRATEMLHNGPYFRVERGDLAGPEDFPGDPRTFEALFLEAGRVALSWAGGALRLEAGHTALVPAGLPWRLEPEASATRWIRISLP